MLLFGTCCSVIGRQGLTKPPGDSRTYTGFGHAKVYLALILSFILQAQQLIPVLILLESIHSLMGWR